MDPSILLDKHPQTVEIILPANSGTAPSKKTISPGLIATVSVFLIVTFLVFILIVWIVFYFATSEDQVYGTEVVDIPKFLSEEKYSHFVSSRLEIMEKGEAL